jgi:hypothetical protein
MRSRSLGLGFLVVVVALSGCSGDGDGGGGGGGQTPAIAVAPKTATCTAGETCTGGGATVTFTATLSGGATGTVTWTLDPAGVGSLSTTTGATTSYTPPDTVAATTVVTVTASTGTLNDSATVTVQPQTPGITVAPKTATRTAGGPAVAFTATLSGGATGPVTWTLDPAGVGSLSATTGAATAYTPPDTVGSTTTVTVTATAGLLSDSATVTVNPAGGGITVAGTVLDANGDPVSGANVSANDGAPVTTGADGGFTIAGVTVPYQLAAVWLPGGSIVGVVLDGLTRTDPVVNIPEREAAPPTSAATFQGRASGPPLPHPVGSAILFSAGPLEDVSAPGAFIDETTDAYFAEVVWNGTGSFAATLHAMYVDDPFDPTEYWHGTRSLAVAPNDAIAGQDLTLTALQTGNLSVTATLPAGFDCAGAGSPCNGLLLYFAQFDDGAIFEGGADPFTTTPATFVSTTPNLGGLGGSLSLEVATENALGEASNVSRTGVAATATVALDPRDPPVPTAPADNATGVGPGTVFSWTAAAFADGVHTLTVTRGGVVPRSLYVYTEAASVVLPDLSALGLLLPPGAPSYVWTVSSDGPAALDDMAGPGGPTAATSFLATGVSRTFER